MLWGINYGDTILNSQGFLKYKNNFYLLHLWYLHEITKLWQQNKILIIFIEGGITISINL